MTRTEPDPDLELICSIKFNFVSQPRLGISHESLATTTSFLTHE